MQETPVQSWVKKICQKEDRLLTPVFLVFPSGSAGKGSTCNMGHLGSVPELGGSPGEGKGYPFQYSVLENSTESMGLQRVGQNWVPFTFTLLPIRWKLWCKSYTQDGTSLSLLHSHNSFPIENLCISFLLLNKLPHMLWLRRTHVYYLTISVNVDSVFCAQSLTGLQLESIGFHGYPEAWLGKNPHPGSFRLWAEFTSLLL